MLIPVPSEPNASVGHTVVRRKHAGIREVLSAHVEFVLVAATETHSSLHELVKFKFPSEIAIAVDRFFGQTSDPETKIKKGPDTSHARVLPAQHPGGGEHAYRLPRHPVLSTLKLADANEPVQFQVTR